MMIVKDGILINVWVQFSSIVLHLLCASKMLALLLWHTVFHIDINETLYSFTKGSVSHKLGG